MKTHVTKKNALIIIENALKQESLVVGLEKLLNTDCAEYTGGFGVLEPLFNIEFAEMDEDDYKRCWNVFYDQAELPGFDFKMRAEIVYKEMLSICLSAKENFEYEHESTILEIIEDALAYTYLTESLTPLLTNYVSSKGYIDFSENVRGVTKAFALMGIDDSEANDDVQNNLLALFNVEAGRDINSEKGPRNRGEVAKIVLKKWKDYLSGKQTKAA